MFSANMVAALVLPASSAPRNAVRALLLLVLALVSRQPKKNTRTLASKNLCGKRMPIIHASGMGSHVWGKKRGEEEEPRSTRLRYYGQILARPLDERIAPHSNKAPRSSQQKDSRPRPQFFESTHT